MRLHLLPRLLLVLLGLAGSRASLAAPAGPAAAHAAASRPNLVFILTDDQDVDLGSLRYMPFTASLIGARGMTFAQDFVPLSLCCPSRSTILTGLYPHNHQVYTNHLPYGGFEKFQDQGLEETTIATALHDAGYRTALFGKYLNQYPRPGDHLHVPPGWDVFVSPNDGDPYSEFDYVLNDSGTAERHRHDPTDYLTDVLAAKAVSFIQGSAGSGQPFFVYLATYAPHVPATPAPRHAALFPGVRAPRTPSFDEADVRDKPLAIRELPRLSAAEVAGIDDLYRLRIQSLQAVDEAVAGIVQALASTGQLDDTYIFFTSDNGFHMGQHRMKPGKYTPYETDVHVPLLVRGPGVAAGSTTTLPTSSVDFAPTLAELGGARLQVTADGRSFVPLMHGQSPAGWRQSVLLEQFAFAADSKRAADRTLEPPDPQDATTGTYFGHVGVRAADWKFVEYDDGEREVYDLRADPDELTNLVTTEPVAWLVQMSALAHALGACSGTACRELEARPLPPLPSRR